MEIHRKRGRLSIMNIAKNAWISSIVGLVAVASLIYIAPKPHYSARGIYLPMTTLNRSHTPIKDIEELDFSPSVSQYIGRVNVQQHLDVNQPGEAHFQEMKNIVLKYASEAGANLFVVTSQGGSHIVGDSMMYTLGANIYFIDHEALKKKANEAKKKVDLLSANKNKKSNKKKSK